MHPFSRTYRIFRLGWVVIILVLAVFAGIYSLFGASTTPSNPAVTSQLSPTLSVSPVSTASASTSALP